MDLPGKILPIEALPAWREDFRSSNKTLVVTNGCFDILHAGHINYLSEAREQGDALLVGLNSNTSVRELKGEDRPVQTETDRATILAALSVVNAVCVFNEARATRFLELSRPDIYAKGGDFTIDDLPCEERAIVQKHGGKIIVIGHVPGLSSSKLAKQITKL